MIMLYSSWATARSSGKRNSSSVPMQSKKKMKIDIVVSLGVNDCNR